MDGQKILTLAKLVQLDLAIEVEAHLLIATHFPVVERVLERKTLSDGEAKKLSADLADLEKASGRDYSLQEALKASSLMGKLKAASRPTMPERGVGTEDPSH